MGKWTHRMVDGISLNGHQSTAWFADDFPSLKKVGRLSVLLFPLIVAIRIWQHRSQFDAIVIHEPSGLWYGILRKLFAWLPPMIIMCHNIESKNFDERLTAAGRGFAQVSVLTKLKTPLFRRWQSDCSIKLADHVICLSTIDRDYLVNKLGRDLNHVTWLINGVVAENFCERKAVSLRQKVLFVGGWLDVKGKHLLPIIWSKVRVGFPSAHLTLAGTSLDSETVLKDFDPEDHEAITVIPRIINEADMIEQFYANDLFLMPSLSEGSPLSLLEAMAAMMPVVASRVGGIPDIITHEVDGLLFNLMDVSDAAEKVKCLLADPTKAANLGVAGRRRVQMLTWEASSRELLSAIHKTLLLPKERD